MQYHPHTLSSGLCKKNNTLYIAKNELSFLKGVPGYGTFDLEAKRVLTLEGQTNRSIWSLPTIFKSIDISYHKKENWVNGHFESVGRGQEFVFQESDIVQDWVKYLILGNSEGLFEKFECETKYVSDIFNEKPKQWGLNGDPYLWEELKQSLSDIVLPYSEFKFENKIVREFHKKVGSSLFSSKPVFVERYSNGGESSGYIDVETWRNKLIPKLINNLKKANEKGNNK